MFSDLGVREIFGHLDQFLTLAFVNMSSSARSTGDTGATVNMS